MAKIIRLVFLMAPVVTVLSAGQDPSARITGPVLGYVHDAEASAVRSVLGMPGAATLGPRLTLADQIHEAAIAQEAGYVLAVAGAERQVWLYRNLGGEVSAVFLSEAPPAPERVLLSPAGSSAALVYGAEVVVVTGVPSVPALRRAALPAASRVWAVSDDGASLLLSAPAGEAEALQLLGPEAELRFLVSTGRTAAAAFLTGSTEAVVADGLHNTVYWLRASGEVLPLAGPADGVSGPVAVSLSRDNRRAFVANADTATVAVLDLAGGPAALVACPCNLAGLERLEGNAVFRLNELSAEPLWVFDGDAPEARVVFIPPEPPAAPAPGGVL